MENPLYGLIHHMCLEVSLHHKEQILAGDRDKGPRSHLPSLIVPRWYKDTGTACLEKQLHTSWVA